MASAWTLLIMFVTGVGQVSGNSSNTIPAIPQSAVSFAVPGYASEDDCSISAQKTVRELSGGGSSQLISSGGKFTWSCAGVPIKSPTAQFTNANPPVMGNNQFPAQYGSAGSPQTFQLNQSTPPPTGVPGLSNTPSGIQSGPQTIELIPNTSTNGVGTITNPVDINPTQTNPTQFNNQQFPSMPQGAISPSAPNGIAKTPSPFLFQRK